MPILDLLASITGEKPSPSPSPNPVSRPNAVLPKRKAEDELRPAGLKAARTEAIPERPPRPNVDVPKSSARPADRPQGRTSDKQSLKPQPALDRRPPNEKSGAASFRAGGVGAGSKPLPSRPLANRPSPTDSGPPKKRSYAEIMARAKANSEQRESLGKIQHKTVERSMTMKERKEIKTEEAKRARTAARRAAAGGTSRPVATGKPMGNGSKSPGMRSSPAVSGTPSTKKTAPVEEKKVKKAALATTGYTGTARPRPGASTSAKPGAAGRPSSEAQSRDRSRYGGVLSTSRRRHEEDEDLDDFIVDDEEEEEEPGYGQGRQYRYDSYDDESDMEAGISDIEDEEQQADRYARREDLEQEALEKRLKREKEERKRKFLDAAKSKAGGR